ncbi:hypothetical protein [Novosphingobium arvoryzae]|uniref:Uncharacterized protein n=1 Tax=Novosphingobium arvoryzae TaxID=1256514 RepID=A0A918VBJ9_9SPHN|nr:hypothetical protein [Novosphingobium arvoryzae]GGZ85774.1 hypothetical protein GCM10011617_00220 [Novosphingobium arvoryzae]
MAVIFDENAMRSEMAGFLELYERRPIQQNQGGMGPTHLFGLYTLLRKIKPKFVIESGVYKGAGTWLIRSALPEAEIFCLDPKPASISWKDPQSHYLERDFACVDWSRHIDDMSECLLFCDDHQNAIRRIQECLWFGVGYAVFEDNYPTGKGDCYTLKTASEGGSFPIPDSFNSYERSDYNWRCAKRFFEFYEEMPPICIPEQTRWGDIWTQDKFHTRAPLFADPRDPHVAAQFLKDAGAYTWLCIVKFRQQFQLHSSSAGGVI